MNKLTAPQTRHMIAIRDNDISHHTTGSAYVGMNNRLRALGLIEIVANDPAHRAGLALTDAGRAALGEEPVVEVAGTSASAVSRVLRLAGLHPQHAESRRFGIFVVGSAVGEVRVRLVLELEGQRRRMAASVVEALTDAGYAAEVVLDEGVPTAVAVAGRIVPAATPAAEAAPATVVSVDGGGSAKCDDCGASLDYSWRVLLSDGRNLNLSTQCLAKRQEAAAAEVAPEPEAPAAFVVKYANEDGESLAREFPTAAATLAFADEIAPHVPGWSAVTFFRAGDYDGAEDVTRETLQAAGREENDAAITARVADEMLRGVTFDRNAASNKSADQMNYRHMVPAATFGKVLAVLGNAAQMGDYYAEAAQRASRKISPYLNDWQIVAGVAEAFGEFVRAGWRDVRAATGPEAGRPSDHQHATTMRQAIILSLVLTEVEHNLQLGYVAGLGWVLERLVREHDVRVNRMYLPRVGEYLAERAAKRAEAEAAAVAR